MQKKYDFLIVGAGFSGVVMAEQLASRYGKTSLIVEKRDHIAGNAYDAKDNAGVLIHQYGPHYFRTNSDEVRDYLSQFTEWQPTEYTIKSFTEGRFWNFPINLNTFEQLVGHPATSEEMEAWLEENKVPIEEPKNSEEVIISQVGWDLYKKFFEGYTLKQWKRHPRDLDASVCGRIPIRTNRDDRYLRESFQALPKDGYTKMFERMLKSCQDKVTIQLNTDYREVLQQVEWGHMIYTGPIDEYFDCCFGPLPYRSLRFEPESFGPEELKEREAISGKPGFWQPMMQVNYPNEEDFTRIVEIKHATRQDIEATTIVREYPDDYGPGKEPYYPIPAKDATALYRKYKELSEENPLPAHIPNSHLSRRSTAKAELATRNSQRPQVTFTGRLATYKYYNMDQVVAAALHKAQRLGNGEY
jgi:UDP-galactopyranose mutase